MHSRLKMALHAGMSGDPVRGLITRLRGSWSGSVSWKGLAAVVLGVLLAKWVWILAAPPAVALAAVGERSASADADNLFGVAAPSGDRQVVALPNVRLAGVYAGSRGFAILELDGKKQVGVPLGGEVVRGVTLREIAADHVVIESGGARQRIDLIVAGGHTAIAPAVTPPSAPPGLPAASIPPAADSMPPAALLDSLQPGQREAIRRQLEGGGTH